MVNLWEGGMQSLQIIPADCTFCFFKAASCFHKPSQGDSAIAHERIKAKYNVGFDHFIEEPEIMQLKDTLAPVEGEEEPTGDSEAEETAEPAKKAA